MLPFLQILLYIPRKYQALRSRGLAILILTYALAPSAHGQMEEVVARVEGHPIVWAIGIEHCGEILGVYFIQSNGVPTWVPITLASSTETRVYSRLAALWRTSVLDTSGDTCENRHEVDPYMEQIRRAHQ